jgi:hypothetical protein
MESDLAAITAVIEAANLPFDSRRTILWCLGHLPAALERFAQTYESRFAEEVVRLERGMLTALDEQDAPAGAAVRELLRVLHQHLGLPDPPAPAKQRPSKKSA